MENAFAVISDIHGNLEALNAVLCMIKKKGVDRIICLGDVVGYGADPEACLTRLEEQKAIILKGNHEAMLLGESDTEHCSALGQASNRWTAAHCGEIFRNRMRELPFEYHFGEMDFYHSTSENDGSWPYLNRVEHVTEQLTGTPGKLVVYSHTHRPRLTILDGTETLEDRMVLKSETIAIPRQNKHKYLINVGSVGQQRDSKTDASFVLLETYNNSYLLTFYRIPYNSFRAYRAVLHRGCGADAATYLIREPWRRKAYELLDNGCSRLCRKQTD